MFENEQLLCQNKTILHVTLKRVHIIKIFYDKKNLDDGNLLATKPKKTLNLFYCGILKF